MNLSLFSRQPNYRLSTSVTLASAVGLFKPCIRLEAISELHFFSCQPNYRLFTSVTLKSAVGLFKPCICLEAISELVTFLAVSLIIGFLRPSFL